MMHSPWLGTKWILAALPSQGRFRTSRIEEVRLTMEPQRKPPGLSWQSYAEQLIREAQDAGQFENLPGMGQPIPGLDGYDDEQWWIREKLRREQISVLPPGLAIRAEVARALQRLWQLTSADAVRREVIRINEQIRQANFAAQWGPPSTQMPLEIDAILAEWHARRSIS